MTKSKDERRKEEQLSRNLTLRLYGPRLTNAADRLAAQQMLQRGGYHRQQAQATGYPRIVPSPAAGGAKGSRCVRRRGRLPRPRWPAAALLDRCADLAIAVTREGSGDAAAGVLPAACRFARQPGRRPGCNFFLAGSVMVRHSPSRFGTRCRGRLILRGEALPSPPRRCRYCKQELNSRQARDRQAYAQLLRGGSSDWRAGLRTRALLD